MPTSAAFTHDVPDDIFVSRWARPYIFGAKYCSVDFEFAPSIIAGMNYC